MSPVVMLDDSREDRLVAEACLARSRLACDFVSMARVEELFSYLEEVLAGQRPMPSLLLLDVSMHEMSGWDVLRRVRATVGFERLPVIMMLTNSDHPADRQRAEQLGADGFQTKCSDVVDYVRFFDELGSGPLLSGNVP
jgi:CheY-like chemotaxis protein